MSQDVEKLQAVVFSHGDKRVGVVVDEILDIVEERIQTRAASNDRGIQGSAVVGGKVTEFIDLRALLDGADERWFDGSACGPVSSARVLLVEPSAFARGLLRSDLEAAGHRVSEAADLESALRRVRQAEVDLLLASKDLVDAQELVTGVRALSEGGKLPALGLTEGAGAHDAEPFDRLQPKFDRHGLLAAVEQMTAERAALSA